MKERLPQTHLFGIPLANCTKDEAVEYLMTRLEEKKQTRIAFVNPEAVVRMSEIPDFSQAITTADERFPDGVGLQWAAQFFDAKLVDNVNGTDLFPLLCQRLSRSANTLFLFGGKTVVAERVREQLNKQFPNLKIIGTYHGFPKREEEKELIETLKKIKPDVLLVGLGAPRQELWLEKNLKELPVRLGMGVGGLFDYYAGVKRAPVIMRKLGLEWLWRLSLDPGRLGRQIKLLRFIYFVLSNKNVLQ